MYSNSKDWRVYEYNGDNSRWHKIYFENEEPKIFIDDDRKIANVYVDNGSTIVSLKKDYFKRPLFNNKNDEKKLYIPLTCFLDFFPGLLNKYDDVANPSCVI